MKAFTVIASKLGLCCITKLWELLNLIVTSLNTVFLHIVIINANCILIGGIVGVRTWSILTAWFVGLPCYFVPYLLVNATLKTIYDEKASHYTKCRLCDFVILLCIKNMDQAAFINIF